MAATLDSKIAVSSTAICSTQVDGPNADDRHDTLSRPRTAEGNFHPSKLLQPRRPIDPVPLTFSQLTYWHSFRLHERPSVRQIATATRIHGRLNIEVLRQSIEDLLARHEVLRTQIVVLDGVPMQEVSASVGFNLEVYDCTNLSKESSENEILRLINQLILEPVYVATDPLFCARLAKVGFNEHVLFVAMEHMVCDMYSMNIVLRDLTSIYDQALTRHIPSLPSILVQFADYAVWQHSTHELWMRKHGSYWKERLSGCKRLRFPRDRNHSTANKEGWGTVIFKIDADLKSQLRERSRVRRTTVVMSVFTAYVALILRWCNAPDGVFLYQSDGRANAKVLNTVGFFSFGVHLRIELSHGDCFFDLLNRITKEYCRACEHADSGYLQSQPPSSDLAHGPSFNWHPRESRIDSCQGDRKTAITCSGIRFRNPVVDRFNMDYEPMVTFTDLEEEIIGTLNFPLRGFSAETMESLGRTLLAFINVMLTQPEKRIADISVS